MLTDAPTLTHVQPSSPFSQVCHTETFLHAPQIPFCTPSALQVAKAAFDASTSKWVLEGAVRSPVATMKDIKAQPPITPWNLGVFDALVLADKMTGCPGGFSRGLVAAYRVRCCFEGSCDDSSVS